MDDHTIVDGATRVRPDGPLYAPAPGEGAREERYALRASGPTSLRLEDTEFDLPDETAGAPGGWAGHAFAALLATALALGLGVASGYPGPVSGVVPVPMDMIAPTAMIGAIAAAVAAFLLFMATVRRAAKAEPRPRSRLANRALFLGSGSYAVQIGREGLAIAAPLRRFTVRWTAFDGPDLMAISAALGSGRAPDFPLIGAADARTIDLAQVFGEGGEGGPALEQLLADASTWAHANSFVRLPLQVDANFAAPLLPGGKAAVEHVDEREYLRVSRAAFDAPGGDLPWPRFVAACVLMIARSAPDWPERFG